jgi:hypothetical protein
VAENPRIPAHILRRIFTGDDQILCLLWRALLSSPPLRPASPSLRQLRLVEIGILQFDLATPNLHYQQNNPGTMKKFCLTALLAIGVAHLASAQGAAFGGLEKIMDQDTYERAGLGKLTSDERAVLDGFIRDYVAGKQKDAAAVASAEAVDRAVKERKVLPPEVIESNIVGTFKGYGLRTVFHLANGELWKPTNSDIVKNSPIENPKVVIYRDTFGYKMFIEGASSVRVMRVQ